MPAMHPLHGSGAEGLQGLISTQPWGTELLRVALGWIFSSVKKIFCAFAGVRAADIRKEGVQVSKSQGRSRGQIWEK